MEPHWLDWSRSLLTIAQEGLTYSQDPFDRARCAKVLRIAEEMAASGSGAPVERVRGLFGADEGYVTPKIDVRGVVIEDGRILLVSERMDAGRWTPPGGWADLGSSPAENAVREVLEEAAFETTADRLLAVYDRGKHEHPARFFSAYKIFFHCRIVGRRPADSPEIGQAAFFPEDGLPELSLDRVTERQIHRMFELVRRPDLPPDFD